MGVGPVQLPHWLNVNAPSVAVDGGVAAAAKRLSVALCPSSGDGSEATSLHAGGRVPGPTLDVASSHSASGFLSESVCIWYLRLA